MFDEYARDLIQRLPALGDLDRDACRRALSSAYFHVVRARVQGVRDQRLDSELIGVRSVLRKMANALESVAVFDALNGNSRESAVEAACAFVAAEAVALLAEFDRPVPDALNTDVIRGTSHYVKIEAALLYMIGGCGINTTAFGWARSDFGGARAQGPRSATRRNSLYLIFSLRPL